MKRLLVLVTLLFSQIVAAKVVRLVTIGPGDAFWSAFGHTALAIDNDVFGFGYFSFDLETIQSFINNRMMYELGISEINYEARLAEQQNRNFSIIELDLNEQQVSQLVDYLSWHYQPENQSYRYDYFLNNCSTKIRDLLVLAWPDDFEQLSQKPSNASYFDQTFPAKHQGMMNFGLAIAYGWGAYKQRSDWELMAFPVYLEQQVMRVAAKNIGANQNVYKSKSSGVAEYLFKTHWALMVYVLFWSLILIPRNNLFATKSWFIWHGIVGFLLLAIWFLTPHEAIDWNFNVLLFSPLGLLVLWSNNIKHWISFGWGLWLIICIFLHAWYLLPLLIPASIAMRNWIKLIPNKTYSSKLIQQS